VVEVERAYIVQPVVQLRSLGIQVPGLKVYSRLVVEICDATSYFYGEEVILFQQAGGDECDLGLE
jgi:hypothetical protein